MDKKQRKTAIEAARKKYARLRKSNPLVDELQRRFDLRVDVEAEAEQLETKNRQSGTVESNPDGGIQ